VDAVKKQLGTTSSDELLLNDSKVRDLFKAEIEKYSEKFKGFESVQDFVLIDKDFTTENGMLTPSLKLKRRAVLEKWGPTIDELYKKKKEAKKASANA
jgi:long-chain acyl-CoA synthetase